MDVVVFLFLGGGAIWGGLALVRFQVRQQQHVAATRIAGQLQHRRSGDYPSSCSWCKNTALAKKLFVFRRVDGAWKTEDVVARLQTCSDGDVQPMASVLLTDMAAWRRFCSEKCARESFQSDRVENVEAFSSCEYCSVRFPTSLMRCPNCGAVRVER
jgi:hypothetical protein